MTIIVANPEPLGARIRITALLHTSGSAMTHHPHFRDRDRLEWLVITCGGEHD